METTLFTLCITALTISFIHTASGPDHYLPFIVLSRSRNWSKTKVIMLTIVCGFGHVMSSVIIGFIGVFLGWNIDKVSWFQDIRGDLSGWVLFMFGLAYLIYGMVYAYRNKTHKHFDIEGNDVFVYKHKHGEKAMDKKKLRITPFVLFAIFVMGPSEPLAPLLFFSGTNRSWAEIITIVVTFTITTIVTMIGMVQLGLKGYGIIKTDKLERYVHMIGGLVITICACGMLFWGW